MQWLAQSLSLGPRFEEGLVDQDLHILEHARNHGAALVVAMNKWDAIDKQGRSAVMNEVLDGWILLRGFQS